jgi:nitroreductase
MDTTAADHLLSTTRSVRKRLDLERPVEPEIILECIRLAVQAPTGSNTQLWRWVVVTDQAKRTGLAELYREAGAGYLRSAGATAEGQSKRVYDSAMYLADNLEHVPVHVIPCLVGRIDDVRHAAGFYGSILPAAWSFMLALRARGLGSAWTTIHLGREAEAAALLGIPDNVTQAALLPVAYTIGTDFKPASRPPVEEITYWDTWDHTRP